MTITIATVSIIAIAGFVWFANRVLPFTVCPICAGVFLTWVWLVGAHIAGYQINLAVPALLMGGTVVGVAYQLEKRFRNISAGRLLLWKILFIPSGFIAAYGILEQAATMFLIAAAFLLLASLLLSDNANKRGEAAGLEKKMEDCC